MYFVEDLRGEANNERSKMIYGKTAQIYLKSTSL